MSDLGEVLVTSDEYEDEVLRCPLLVACDVGDDTKNSGTGAFDSLASRRGPHWNLKSVAGKDIGAIRAWHRLGILG